MTNPSLNYEFAVNAEQASELCDRIAPICAEYTHIEVIGACAELVCRVLKRTPTTEVRDILLTAFIETINEACKR